MFEIDKMPGTMNLGYTGEKNFRKIEIDMTAWMEQMPDGIPSIIAVRPWENKADAYKASTTFENNILTWTITEEDLGPEEGEGMMQVVLEEKEDDSVIRCGKSIRVITKVIDGLSVEEAEE